MDDCTAVEINQLQRPVASTDKKVNMNLMTVAGKQAEGGDGQWGKMGEFELCDGGECKWSKQKEDEVGNVQTHQSSDLLTPSTDL